MTTGKINFQSSTNIYKNGNVVGETDKVYSPNGNYFDIAEIIVKGDLSGELEYCGKTIVAEHIDTMIGMEITQFGARGPVWKGVRCKIVK